MRENEGNEKRKCDWQTFCCFNVYRGKKIFISSNIFGSINFDVAGFKNKDTHELNDSHNNHEINN